MTAVQLAAGAVAALPLPLSLEGARPFPPRPAPSSPCSDSRWPAPWPAFWLFAWAQARVPAEQASAFVNLEPLVGALAGVVAFHEAFGPVQALGGLAILAAIALSSVFGNRPRGQAARPARRMRPLLRRAPLAQ